MVQPINVALAADAAYLVHARVTLCSLFDSNKDNQFAVYLFTEAGDHVEIEKIRELVRSYGHRLHIKPVDPGIFKDFFISGHISVATYYRLMIPDQLPPEVRRVLYLDTDIIVKADIRELWETDMKGACLAAVDEKNKNHVERLALPENSPYLNAGVLLIDTLHWKNLDLSRRGLDLAAQYHEKLVAYDQDVLNLLLVGQWLPLPQKWNQTEGHSLGRLLEEPTIIHFVGFKPWTIHCIHPYKGEYYRYYYMMEGKRKKVEDYFLKLFKAFQNRIIPRLNSS